MTRPAKWRASFAASILTYVVLPQPAAADPGSYYETPGTSYFNPSDRRPLDGSYRSGYGPVNWNGLYGGVHGGWAGGQSSTAGAFGQSIDTSGSLGGLHGGYNYQSGSLVTGLEADASWTGVDGSEPISSGRNLSISTDWLSSLRMRLGYATGNWLLYGTAGVALAGVDTALTGPNGGSLDSDTLTGYAVGLGAELALTQSISARVEALHYGMSHETMQTWRGTVDMDLDLTTVHGGLSIKLN